MKFETPQNQEKTLDSAARKRLLIGVLATSLAAFGSDAEGQTPSPERFADIPRIELESSIDANSYEKYNTAVLELRMHIQGLTLTIENGIKNNTITDIDHINELQQQLRVFRESINNAHLMVIAILGTDSLTPEEINEQISSFFMPIFNLLTTSEQLLRDLELKMGEEV